jgi:superfamily II DNA or RNA helicase
MTINVTIDSSIRLNPKDIPKNVLDEILAHLRILNPQKKIAEKEMLWNAKNIPSHLELWKYNSHNELILPRGFRANFESIIDNNNIKINLFDKSTYEPLYFFDVNEIDLRDYQNKAVGELYKFENGIYSAPTGAGKSRVMLELIRLCHQKSIIFCEKRDIAQQWINYARELGFGPCAYIGENEWSDNTSLVIALRQSVWSKKDKLDQDWFDQFGCIIYDEIHHLSAPTAFEIIQRFPAYYRFGCSATPDSDQDLFPIVSAAIGPVVHLSPVKEIGHHLVIPSVRVVKTEFEFPYRPTRRVSNGRNLKIVRNNYNDMMVALEENHDRNLLIMSKAHNSAQAERTCLVLSKKKKHLKYLYNLWNEMMYNQIHNYDIYFLTGDNSKDYNMIKDEIELSRGCIIFSTLADEGTNIPKLDRIFLSYPGRKLRGYEQSIGRIMRPHPQKKDAIVYDFRDASISLLNSQFRDRAQNIYNKKKYKIENL